MTGIQTGGIWILRHELLGQLSDIFSAHQGQAPCPCWVSSVPRLGKQRAHFPSKCSHQDVNVISCNSLQSFTPIRDKIAISCMLREIHEFSSHAIRHGLYIKNRKRLFCP